MSARRPGIRDEFLNLDFPTTGQLFDYAEHPFMKKVSRELLEPLFQFYIRIRDDFSWAESTKPRLRSACFGSESVIIWKWRICYVQARLSDMILRYEEMAVSRRLPVPRVLWMQCVLRADSVYGFEGDKNWMIRDILRGKLASLYKYSAELREHVVDRILQDDVEIHHPKRALDAANKVVPETEEGEVSV
ncbi:hypothetical protein C8R44DRAFT_878818 [Mycena epipterygia]|nr:hypothetical protein C8R44DRAFT_878818 [Mycena epipterygia]